MNAHGRRARRPGRSLDPMLCVSAARAGGTPCRPEPRPGVRSARRGRHGRSPSGGSVLEPEARKPEGFPGDNGRNGFGGGLYAAGGTVSLSCTTAYHNTAQGGGSCPGFYSGPKGNPGLGEGGGLSIDPAASVGFDAFTLANFQNNTASASDPDIHGSYTT